MSLGGLLSKKGKDYFYIMHLSYEGRERDRLWAYAQQHDLVGLDYYDVAKNWDDLTDDEKEKFRKKHPRWFRQFNNFCYDIKRGDIISVLEGWYWLLGIAEVAEPHHRYEKELGPHGSTEQRFFDHVRNVTWRQTNRKRMSESVVFNNTLSKVNQQKHTKRWQILTSIDI